MNEFKTIPSDKSRTDLKLSLVLGVATFLIYLLTLSPGTFPGVSATLVAQAAGLESRGLPTHPLFHLIANGLAGVPVFGLALRLNLFSAVCGALSVVLVYRLVSFFIYEVMTEEFALAYAARVAKLSAVVAAVAMAFSVPVWEASTRLSYQSFDLLLLLLAAALLANFAKCGFWAGPYLFGLLYGVGIAETPQFISFAPLFLFCAIVVLWKRKQLTMRRVTWMGWAAVVGMGTYFLAAWRFTQTEDVTSLGLKSVMDVVVAVWRDQYGMLRTSLPRVGWLTVLLLGAMPWLAAMFAAPRSLNNDRSWSHYILHLTLSVLTVLALLNLAVSPWGIMGPYGQLPVVTYVMVSVVAGYLVGYWYLLPRLASSRRGSSTSKLTLRVGNWLGLGLAVPLVAFVVVAGAINFFEANGRRGRFADACAGEVLDRMGGRTWIVTDGTLDAHLQVLARERNRPLRLLCLQKDGNVLYQAQIKRLVKQERLFPAKEEQRMMNSIDLGVLPFVQDWFASDPEIEKKVVVFGVPDLWYGAGMTPVPDGLFFTGVRVLDEFKDAPLLPAYQAFWDRMEKLLPHRKDATEQVAVYRNHLRRHMGFVANNLGVMLEDLEREAEAYTVYARVRKMDPDNISALFNQFEMVRRGKLPEEKIKIEKDLKEFLSKQQQRYPLWSLSRYFGYVRSPELFARLGFQWAMSGQMGGGNPIERWRGTVTDDAKMMMMDTMARIYTMQDDRTKSEAVYLEMLKQDPANRQALVSMARLSVQAGALDQARSWLDKAQDLGISRGTLGIEWAVVHLASGDLKRARMLLQETTDLQPKNLQAWALLAMVQLQQGDIDDVEKVVLSKMENVAGTADHYFVQITRAQVAMKKGKESYRVAREAFIRASMLRPDIPGVKDMILTLDIALNDEERAELHARQVLRTNRNHALANYVMGSLRLGDGKYGEAEDYLRRSVGVSATSAALNDLAEVLRRNRKLEEAETFARQAVQKNAELYVAWETLGSILMERGSLDEAEKAIDKSLALYGDDPRVKLTMARLQVRKGNLMRAREILLQVRKSQSELPAFDQQELARLTDELNRKTR
jgi:tetratricopeptide (TPR) repeat protein